MENSLKKELKKKINNLKPSFRVGKEEIEQSFIESISKYIDKHELCKLKIISENVKEEIQEIAQKVSKKTNSSLIEIKGFTFTIYKKKEDIKTSKK